MLCGLCCISSKIKKRCFSGVFVRQQKGKRRDFLGHAFFLAMHTDGVIPYKSAPLRLLGEPEFIALIQILELGLRIPQSTFLR